MFANIWDEIIVCVRGVKVFANIVSRGGGDKLIEATAALFPLCASSQLPDIIHTRASEWVCVHSG